MNAMELLAQPQRMRIMQLVWDAERSAGEIARRFQVTFGAISQHLAKLHAANLVMRRRDGRTIYYRANREALGPLAPALEAMWREQLDILKTLAEDEQARINGVAGKKSKSREKSRKKSGTKRKGSSR